MHDPDCLQEIQIVTVIVAYKQVEVSKELT